MFDLQWRSFRGTQNFPFADEASCTATTGDILPKSFLLDIRLQTNVPYTQYSNFYISGIYKVLDKIKVELSYKDKGLVAVCSGIDASLGLTDDTSKRWFSFQAVHNNSDITVKGSLCIGTCQDLHASYRFTFLQGRLNPMCVSGSLQDGNQLQGLQSINIADQSGTIATLSGVVTLLFGPGIKVQVQEGPQNKVFIQMDKEAVKEWADAICSEYIEDTYKAPILTINGAIPDQNGNINIVGSQCIQIVSQVSQGSITIRNTCNTPCCTQPQWDQALRDSLQLLKAQHQVLKDYFLNQASVINYMQANLSNLFVQS